jgi:hypothetical protein
MIAVNDEKEWVAVFTDATPKVYETCGKLEHITLMFCVSASGDGMKLLAIYPLRCDLEQPPELTHFFDHTGTDSGWINEDKIKNWLFYYFINDIEYNRG